MPDKPPSFIPDSFIPDKVAQPSSTFFHSDAIHGGIADPTIGWDEKLSNLAFGRNDPSVQGPGLMKIPGMESAGDWIRNKAINSGNYYVGAGGSLLGDLLSGASTGFDPRAVALKGSEFTAPKEANSYEPVTRVIRPNDPIEGNYGKTWVVRGHLDDTEAAKLKDLYTGPDGRVIRGYAKSSELEPQQMFDENNHPITFLNNEKSKIYESIPKYDPAVLGAEDATSAMPPKPVQDAATSAPKQLGPAKDIQLPAGNAWPTETEKGYYQTGKPTEPLQPNSTMPVGEVPNPSLDQLNSAPKVARSVEDISKIPPGQADVPQVTAAPKDISPFRAEVSSPHVVMQNFPQSSKIIQPIMDANDTKYKWLATTEREFAGLSKGLSGEDRTSLMHILNGDEVPNASPQLMQIAGKAKDMLDGVFDLAQESSPDNEIGFIDRYITHIQKQPDDIKSAISSIIQHQFGKESGIGQVFSGGTMGESTGELGDLYGKGLGDPSSQFTKYRSGKLTDIETDYNKIMPTYLESMAKIIFDKPAVDAAKDALTGIPASKLKDYLSGYIQNYTKYDSDAQLANAWGRLASQIGTINARSAIAFNPAVHMLHLGQLPANVWPELGTKYSLQGMQQFLGSPLQSYQELAKNGLFTSQIRPMQFQTAMQKVDSVGYFMNMVESVVKGTGYYGFKARALDAGMSDAEATMKAIAETKNATATVDPARSMRLFTPESNAVGGQLMYLAKQYKQIPFKLVEQFATAAADFKNNPAKAARYVAGTGIAVMGATAGLHTAHTDLTNMMVTGGLGQFGSMMTYVYKDLARGDADKALGELATWLTPAGGTIRKLTQ